MNFSREIAEMCLKRFDLLRDHGEFKKEREVLFPERKDLLVR